MIGFAMHNTAYRVTVQWRYGVYMKGPRGPFQTSITINVQNLVVTSGDVGKILKWDPDRPEICDTSFGYDIECAQKKQVQVRISIYSMDGQKVYEVTEQKMCPGSYGFVWDGSVNTGYGGGYEGEPSNIAPAGLYTFDVEVVGSAYYDADGLRSKTLIVEPSQVEYLGVDLETDEHYYLVRYSLISEQNASNGILYFLNQNLEILQTWDISGLFCLDHEIQDSLEAYPEGKQHTLLVIVPGSILESGQYCFILVFTDNSRNNSKNHMNKLTLHVGEYIAIDCQTKDTIFYDILGMFSYSYSDTIPIDFGESCPPQNPLPRPEDIDRDGEKDWDYPGDQKIPGTNYVVGVFGIIRGYWLQILGRRLFSYSGSFYLLTIGIDENNNGLLEGREIRYWIGICPYPNGRNKGWIKKETDGRWYVHWTSYDDKNRNGKWDRGSERKRGEPFIHFIYNPYENILKVFLVDENGNTLLKHQGPPQDYFESERR